MSPNGSKAEIKGKVSFVDVSFRYPGTQVFVLRHISFEMEQGKRFGVTGASGSGKSSLAQLLLRFYDPQKGKVLIDDVDISSYNVRHLRESISYVGQEPVLFSGSVRNNVDFGFGKSGEEIRQALLAAHVPHFFDKLDHKVGFRGGRVSGGRKQRLAIARAIIRNPTSLSTRGPNSKSSRRLR